MKYCENCKKTYPDSENFCTRCGRALVFVPEQPQCNTDDSDNNRPDKKRRRPIWKVILTTLAILVIGFIALRNYVMNAATYLRVEPNMLVAGKNGGEIVVEIDYDGYVWSINNIPDWIAVEELNNNFIVKADANLTGRNREGTITVQRGKHLASVSVQQKGQATYIKASKQSINFDREGGLKTVRIVTDGCNYTVEYPDFLTVVTDNNDIKIKANSNSNEYRSGYITISEDYVRTRILVTQGGTCNVCHGARKVYCSYCNAQGGFNYGLFYSQCSFCGGEGYIRCNACKGTGVRK